MNELMSSGIILLMALLAGHLVKLLRVPEVTGYLLVGIVIGPSAMGWLTHDNLIGLGVLSEVALGLILFSVGAVFELSLFRRIGRSVFVITLCESAAAAALVGGGSFALGLDWRAASLLGVIAMATAPASTLMVIRECDSTGPMTDHLLAIIAVNNLLCLTAFGLLAALIDVTMGVPGMSDGALLYRSVYWFIWGLLGSASLGFLFGLLLAAWASQITEGGELLILLAGAILFCVGASRVLNVSPLVASLMIGATMVNLSGHSRRLFDALSRTDPPFYALFFVIAGAELDLGRVPAMGAVGLVYIVGRTVGKVAGATLASWRLGLGAPITPFLGPALLAQAGLAVGLTLAVNTRYPAFAGAVTTVVLASVAVFEVIGPASTRISLTRAGEVRAGAAIAADPMEVDVT
jgi:Kef-type K+ transport system membrane component KefB